MIAEQDYPAAQLQTVIVDDSPPSLRLSHPSWDVLRPGSQTIDGLAVEYITLNDLHSIGEKRNIAVNHSTHSIIMHWDDDDIYGAARIRRQVEPIVRSDADMTLLEHQAVYFMEDDELLIAEVPHKPVPSWGPHFGTLAYRKALWGGHEAGGLRFQDHSEAEDYGFAQAAVQHHGVREPTSPRTLL